MSSGDVRFDTWHSKYTGPVSPGFGAIRDLGHALPDQSSEMALGGNRGEEETQPESDNRGQRAGDAYPYGSTPGRYRRSVAAATSGWANNTRFNSPFANIAAWSM